MCLKMTSGRLEAWHERNGIFSRRIHCIVYGLDCVVSFSGRWLRYYEVAPRAMFSNLADEFCCMMHGAWVTAAITVVLRALMLHWFLIFLLHDQFHLKTGCEISYVDVSCN